MMDEIIDGLEEAYHYFLGQWKSVGNHPASMYRGYTERMFESLVIAKELKRAIEESK